MENPLLVRYKKIHPDALAPEYKTAGAAGFDIALVEDLVIPPRSMVKSGTGLVVQVPEGYFLLIASRSSNTTKKGITLANGIGVLDSDYRGPTDQIWLVIENVTDAEVRLTKGDRVAQGIVIPCPAVALEEIAGAIDAVDRGGFGSTG